MSSHFSLSITEKEMLIIAGPSCNPVILHRFMQHFYNRKIKLHVYDPPPIPGHLENKTLSYQDVMDLPIDLPAIYILCDKTFHTDEGLRRWILRLSRPRSVLFKPYFNTFLSVKQRLRPRNAFILVWLGWTFVFLMSNTCTRCILVLLTNLQPPKLGATRCCVLSKQLLLIWAPHFLGFQVQRPCQRMPSVTL